jgi:CRISPR-associated endoribonuclease Cas6
VLPYAHQYQLTGGVYRTLQRADPHLATWLHDARNRQNGYQVFCFSWLMPRSWRATPQGLSITGPTVDWEFGSPLAAVAQTLEAGLRAAGGLRVGSLWLDLAEIVDQRPRWPAAPVEFAALTPVVLTRPVPQRPPDYVVAGDADFVPALCANIAHRAEPFLAPSERDGVHVELATRRAAVRTKLVRYADQDIRGSMATLRIHARPPLLAFLYCGGLGEKTGMGFGMLAVRRARAWTAQDA